MCVSACVWCLGLEVPTVDVDALSEGDQQVAPAQPTLPTEVSDSTVCSLLVCILAICLSKLVHMAGG